jgi:hypothetical protein
LPPDAETFDEFGGGYLNDRMKTTSADRLPQIGTGSHATFLHPSRAMVDAVSEDHSVSV